jgi:hypothetical protein
MRARGRAPNSWSSAYPFAITLAADPAVSSLLNEHDLTKRNRWLTAGFELKQSFAQYFHPGFVLVRAP